jgi:hypothetical protein
LTGGIGGIGAERATDRAAAPAVDRDVELERVRRTGLACEPFVEPRVSTSRGWARGVAVAELGMTSA